MTERAVSDLDAPGGAEPLEASPTRSEAAGRDDSTTRPNTRVIWLLLASTFVVFLNETIMGVAVPHLVDDLGITVTAAQWLTTAFLLTMAVVIPITGFLLQRFPTRPIFITAMTLFSAGTLLAALAPGFEVLLAARVVQASGTAIMMPLLMTTLMTVVPAAERGRFMGRVSIVMSVAPAIGPTISGLILSLASWRFMFWLVLPIAVTMLIIGIRKVETVNEPRRLPIDLFSVVLSAFGFGGLVYGLSQLGGEGGGHGSAAADAAATPTAVIWIAFGVGVAGIAAFIWRQIALQRHDRALLDLRTFRSRNFSISVALMIVLMASLFGTIIVLPYYLQRVLLLDPLETGLLLLPGGLLMGLLGPVVGRLYDRFGPTPLLVPASIVLSGALWSFTMLGETTPVWLVLLMHLAMSAALAFMFTPLFTSALGSVQPRFYSHGSAIIGTVQQVAGATGTALFIAVMAGSQTAAAAAGAAEIAAQAQGIRAAFLVGAIVSLGAIVGALFIRRPADLPEGAPTPH
ncbi:DHA2 family efflux MFS transporter permease subunit [Agromyces silvae]|uniref:DHA2 family efflux MFS transporter permease subunit n=1 Tax=Agromyces silvae TaxID=3388266 RepID=UPI00280A9D42|nr:DHA2 family efflux MFS transporter permease subunit [Agromyces protaetiae]